MKRTNNKENLFSTRVIVSTHLEWADNNEGTPGCQESIGSLLRFFDGHRVKDVRQRDGNEFSDTLNECGFRQFAIQDVRCAQGEE